MRIRIRKSDGTALLLTFCYSSTILEAIIPDNAVKYGMYALITGLAIFLSLAEDKVIGIAEAYPVLLIESMCLYAMTILSQIIHGPNPGTLIQPVFLLSCFKLGFHTAGKNGEQGCVCVLKQFSCIIAFAAVIGIPEYFMKQSLFFPNYGHEWEAFRIPSIYGHPIRLGTSLTIGLAVYIYLYKKSAQKYILIALSLFGIYGCASRSSWLACAGTAVLTLISVYGRKISKKKSVYGLAAALLLLIFLMSKPGSDLISSVCFRFAQGTGNNVSKMQRIGAISYIWKEMTTHINPFTFLFGHGEDAAAGVMLQTSIVFRDFSTTDNEYILVMYNYGMIFLAFVLWGICRCVRNYVKNYRINSNAENCLCFICISQAICSFFYEITENKSCAFLLICCIGMLMGLKRNKRRTAANG